MHAETLREWVGQNYRLQDIQLSLTLDDRSDARSLFEQDCLGRPAFAPSALRRAGRITACRAEARAASEGGTPGSKFAGGHRSRVTPVPIPNTEVKPATADGTAWETVWESRSLPALFRRKPASFGSRAFAFVRRHNAHHVQHFLRPSPVRRTRAARTPWREGSARAPPPPGPSSIRTARAGTPSAVARPTSINTVQARRDSPMPSRAVFAEPLKSVCTSSGFSQPSARPQTARYSFELIIDENHSIVSTASTSGASSRAAAIGAIAPADPPRERGRTRARAATQRILAVTLEIVVVRPTPPRPSASSRSTPSRRATSASISSVRCSESPSVVGERRLVAAGRCQLLGVEIGETSLGERAPRAPAVAVVVDPRESAADRGRGRRDDRIQLRPCPPKVQRAGHMVFLDFSRRVPKTLQIIQRS